MVQGARAAEEASSGSVSPLPFPKDRKTERNTSPNAPIPDQGVSFAPSSPKGLDADEAARRLEAEGPNLLPGSAPKSTIAIVRDVVTEPMFLMLLAGGAIYFALGDHTEAIFLLSFVVLVIGITLAQERKTQRALESLRDLSAPRALVLRDGQEQRIAGRDVVRGDLLALHEGDRIAADAVLVRGEVEVDESLLTGEAVPVAKTMPTGPDDAGRDSSVLHASTVITRGVALAEVIATGAKTAVGRIGMDLNRTVEPPSALQQGSRRLVRTMGMMALALAIAQVLLGVFGGRPVLESLLSGIALAMALLPEEIPLILTVFLALGAWRISRLKVLARRVSAVEALGAITVLAVDKTGTLTVNRMEVAELATAELHFHAEGSTELPEAFHVVTEFAMLATPGDPFDPMEKAI
jgi:P-type Ca2+ transporter type 2C